MAKKKQPKENNYDRDSTMTCECGAVVKVSTGGEANLVHHREGAAHKQNMAQKRIEATHATIKSFFTQKKPPLPPVPRPPILQKNQVNVDSVISGVPASRLLEQLKQAISTLPTSVPAGTSDDFLSQFSTLPFIPENATGDELWEDVLDPVLNRFLGFGRELPEIKGLIRRGPHGMDGFYGWIAAYLQTGKVNEVLLEGKISRLVNALSELSETNPGSQLSGPVSQALEPLLSPPLENDEDDCVQIIEPPVSNRGNFNSRGRVVPCKGYKLVLPPGHSPFASYPFFLHSEIEIPWSVDVNTESIHLKASDCLGLSIENPCCHCTSLGNNSILLAIQQRIENGVKEHTNWKFMSHEQLLEYSRRILRERDQLKLGSLNLGRKLASRARALEDHKRLLLTISSGKVQNVQRLIEVALHNNFGVKGLLDQMQKAMHELYAAKSYQERDYNVAMLLWRFGGARVASIASKSLSLPSLSTLRRKQTILPLHVSPRSPTVEEITQNIKSVFGDLLSTSDLNQSGYVLMVDEIAVESRLRYDARNNTILGTCREHCRGYSLAFTSQGNADLILRGLHEGEIHFACEATVIAIGSLEGESRLHAVRPIAISGTCKCESAEDHAALLQNVLKACEPFFGNKLFSISSDGEAKRGRALNYLTRNDDLKPTSPIYPLLGELSLFDLAVGINDLTCDKDYKHIFKRFRNAILSSKGILLNGDLITTALVRQHLADTGIQPVTLAAMLNPNDRQDVPLAVSLLKALWNLPQVSSDALPSYAVMRKSLTVLGDLFGSFVKPFITPAMDLTQQLTSLSTASHLALALYYVGRNHFLNSQLYVDLQLCIKNVYFCVAKMQHFFPRSQFYLTLMGTDRLESQFGSLRTIIGSDQNVDILQLGSRLTAAMECTRLLSIHPDWDRGPRRLQVSALGETGELLGHQVDHLSPRHWGGNVDVSSMDLSTVWKQGRHSAEEILKHAQIDSPFRSMELLPHHTILAPFGQPLMKANLNLDENEEAQADDPLSMTIATTGSQLWELSDESLMPDLEDLVDGEPENSMTSSSSTSHSHTILVNGRSIHKASILRLYSHPLTVPGPTSLDRLKRVRGFKRFDGSIPQDVSNHTLTSEPTLFVNDPALTLVKVQTNIFLAVMQINGLQDGTTQLQSISVSNLQSGRAIKIFFQILKLRPSLIEESSDSNEEYEWIADGTTVKYGTDFRTLEGSPAMIQPFNPNITCDVEGKPIFHFSNDELTAITCLLHERLTKNPHCHIPTVRNDDFFPYRYNGRACFVCQDDNETTPLGLDKTRCNRCGPNVYLKNGQQVITHNSSHILFDQNLKIISPCGFCLRGNSMCTFFLKKGKNTQLDYPKCVCPWLLTVSYKTASQFTENSPCTNIPIQCPVCPAHLPAIWRYNLKKHLQMVHPDVSLDDYTDLWVISTTERKAMQMLWARSQNARSTAKKKAREGIRERILISEGHASSLALRATDLEIPRPEETQTTHSDSVEPVASNVNTNARMNTRSSRRKRTEIPILDYNPSLDGRSSGESDDDNEFIPDNDTDEESDREEEPNEYETRAFNINSTSRLGRQRRSRITVDQTICDCDGAEIIDRSNNSWRSNPSLIECRGAHCETQIFHMKCQGLTVALKNWKCESCNSSYRKSSKRAKKA